MPITLKSTGGGSVSIDVPSTGSTFTLTAPANNATIFTTDGGAITGNVAFTSNNISIGGQTISPAVGMRNRIINGDMRIDQRNAGASVSFTSGGQYFVDRWCGSGSASSKASMQQSSVAPTGFTNSLLITSSTAWSLGVSDYATLNQYIEGYNVADLGWGTANAKTVTLSFWVRSSLTGTFGGAINNQINATAATRSLPFSFTISSANTWEQKTITVLGDTSGTWGSINSSGISVIFSLAAGANYLSSSSTWISSDAKGYTGQTNLLATNGATFYITGVQLEVGSVATPFERRLYGQELALCQRYYETNYEIGTAPGSVVGIPAGEYINLNGQSSGFYVIPIKFAVRKRSVPTVTIYSGNTGASGKVQTNRSGNPDGGGGTVVITSSGFSGGLTDSSTGCNQISFMWTAAIEL